MPRARRLIGLTTILCAAVLAGPGQAHAASGPCALSNLQGNGFLQADGTTGAGFLSESVALPNPRLTPSVGELVNLVVFVDFPDVQHEEGEDPVAYARAIEGSTSFLRTASYGRLTVQTRAANTTWMRMPAPRTSYANNQEILQVAWRMLNEQHPGAYQDVRIATLAFPRATALRSNAEYTPIAGTPLTGAIYYQTGSVDPAYAGAVIAHETAHVLGLPDLYDVHDAGDPSATAGYDLMAAPFGDAPDLLAWQKWKLGWVDDPQIACFPTPGTGRQTITPLHTGGGVKALVVPTGEGTVQVAEVRGRGSIDSHPCSLGVLIYTIDARVLTGRNPVHVHPSGKGSCAYAPYNGAWPAGSTYTDPATKLRWTIGAAGADGSYSVSVTAPVTYARTLAAAPNLVASYRLGEPAGDGVAQNFSNDRAFSAQGIASRIGRYVNGPQRGNAPDGPSPRTPMGGLATTFDGVDDHVTVPLLGAPTDFTIEGWTKLDASPNALNTLYGGPKARLMIRKTGVSAAVTVGTASYTITATTPDNSTAWAHWALVRKGTVLTVYRNGVRVGTTNAPTGAVVVSGTIGALNGTSAFLKGSVAEVALYSAGLMQTTTASRYKLGVTGQP